MSGWEPKSSPVRGYAGTRVRGYAYYIVCSITPTDKEMQKAIFKYNAKLIRSKGSTSLAVSFSYTRFSSFCDRNTLRRRI